MSTNTSKPKNISVVVFAIYEDDYTEGCRLMMVDKKKLKPFKAHLKKMRSPDFEEYDFSCGIGYVPRVGSMYRKNTPEQDAEQARLQSESDPEGEVAHLKLLRVVMEEGEKYDYRATKRVYKMFHSDYEGLLEGHED